MKSQLLCPAMLFIAMCGISDDDYVNAGIPIPVFWGSGEELTEMGELPSSVSAGVAKELGTEVTVAFIHERLHLFWLDLWTWNGRHVLHSGDTYWELDSKEWQRIIGADPAVEYGKPILYQIPLLPALIAVVAVLYAIRKKFFKSEEERLELLLSDQRYLRSIATIFGTSDQKEPAKLITTIDEQAFLRAKRELIGEGVDAHTAESNLRKVADAVVASTDSQIDDYFQAASRLDQEGEWHKSAELYAQLASSLPDNDERLNYAKNCLAAVNEKRLENTTVATSEIQSRNMEYPPST